MGGGALTAPAVGGIAVEFERSVAQDERLCKYCHTALAKNLLAFEVAIVARRDVIVGHRPGHVLVHLCDHPALQLVVQSIVYPGRPFLVRPAASERESEREGERPRARERERWVGEGRGGVRKGRGGRGVSS